MDFSGVLDWVRGPFKDEYFDIPSESSPYRIPVPFLEGQDLPLTFWDDRVSPDKRVEMLNRLVAIPPEARATIGKYLFYRFHEAAEEYSHDFGSTEEWITWLHGGEAWTLNGGRAPMTPEEVWPFVPADRIEIGDPGTPDGENSVFVQFRAIWDEDHGATMVFRNGDDFSPHEEFFKNYTPPFMR